MRLGSGQGATLSIKIADEASGVVNDIVSKLGALSANSAGQMASIGGGAPVMAQSQGLTGMPGSGMMGGYGLGMSGIGNALPPGALAPNPLSTFQGASGGQHQMSVGNLVINAQSVTLNGGGGGSGSSGGGGGYGGPGGGSGPSGPPGGGTQLMSHYGGSGGSGGSSSFKGWWNWNNENGRHSDHTDLMSIGMWQAMEAMSRGMDSMHQYSLQRITTPYGMSNMDYARQQLGYSSAVGGTIAQGAGSIIGGLLGAAAGATVGMSGPGALLGSQLGGQVGGMASRGAYSGLEERLEVEAIKEQLYLLQDSSRDRGGSFTPYMSKKVGPGLDFNIFGYRFHHTWNQVNPLVDDERALQRQLSIGQMTDSLNSILPGVDYEDVSSINSEIARRTGQAEGDLRRTSRIANARRSFQRSNPELIGMNMNDIQNLPPGQRQAYSAMAAYNGDFDGFSMAFGATPGEAAGMRNYFQQTQLARFGSARAGGDVTRFQLAFQEEALNGAGGSRLASVMGNTIEGQQGLVGSLQTQANLASSLRGTQQGDLVYQQILNELKSATLELTQMRKQQQEIGFESREQFIGVDLARSGRLQTSAAYAGSEAGIYQAVGGRRSALNRRAQLLDERARSPFASPEEVAQYREQAEQIRLESGIGTQREMNQIFFGMRQQELGTAGARAGERMSEAQLFGGSADVYRAGMGQAQVTQSNLRLVDYQLNNARQLNLTPQETESLRERQVSLQRELNEALTMTTRRLSDATVSVAQFQQGITAGRAGIEMSFFGVGGGGAASLQSGSIGAANRTYDAALQRFQGVQNLPADNPYRMQAEQALQQAEASRLGAQQGMANLPFSVGLQRDQMAGQFALGAMGRTFLPYGDMRGAIGGLMNNVSARGIELRDMERSAYSEIDSDERLTTEQKAQRKQVLGRDFDSRRYSLGNEALGYQQQLETGWMDRIISQSVNSPQRGRFVTSRFTANEAAPFLQAMSSVFGFSGEGGMEARDNFLFRGGRIASSLNGVIQRPEGFNETAMAGGVLRPGIGGRDGVKGAADALVQATMALAQALGQQAGSGGPTQNANSLGNHNGTRPFQLPHFSPSAQ